MLTVHQFILYLHIVLGAFALIIFWGPVLVKKGSGNHILMGRMFNYSMLAVAVSGVVMSLMVIYDPIAIRYPSAELSPQQLASLSTQQRQLSEFLLMLSLLVWVSVRHATLVLQAKQARQQLKTLGHLLGIGLLTLSATRVLYIAIDKGSVLYAIFAGIGLFTAITTLYYIYKPTLKPREWVLEHMTTIIGAGIAVYTAFFAVGGRHWLMQVLPGAWQLLPWVLPGIIGTVAINRFKKRIAKQYRIA